MAIYVRVSTVEQADEGYSLMAQEKTLSEYCRSRGYEIIGVYKDEGISAKDIKHRPQMVKLLDDAKNGKFDVLLVWKLTRLTRSLPDLCAICDKLDRHGVSFISYSESFDCSTPAGRMMRNILGVVAQWEREVISENVKLAMAERAAQGKRTCSYVLGYEKDGDSLRVNPAEAELVKFIYKQYLTAKNIKQVSDLCCERGYTGKMGGKLKPESIHKILTRFVYCGFYSFLRVPHKGSHEAIIDVDTYNQVQEIMLQNTVGRERKHELVFLKD